MDGFLPDTPSLRRWCHDPDSVNPGHDLDVRDHDRCFDPWPHRFDHAHRIPEVVQTDSLRLLVRGVASCYDRHPLALFQLALESVMARKFRIPFGAEPTLEAIRKSAKQSERKRDGEAAEALVRADCVRRGFVMVEQVHTPFGVTKDGRRFAKEKVSGDIRAVQPIRVRIGPTIEVDYGISVLIEVKKRDATLAWSDLAHSDGSHQSEELDKHRNAGGITEVAWVDREILHSIPWSRFREIGFGPGLSITWTGNDIEITKPAVTAKKGL